MSVVKAHFDGNVFVPDGPVDCPKNTPLRLTVETADEEHPLMELVRLAEGFSDDPGWPTDGASQHDHYLYGTPKTALLKVASPLFSAPLGLGSEPSG